MGGQTLKFEDRAEAGRLLAEKLPANFRNANYVFGIPSGGMVCALPIANALGVRLEPAFVSKLPLPWNPEVAIGVIASDGEVILDEGSYRQMGVSYMDVQKIARMRLSDLKRRQQNVTLSGEDPFNVAKSEIVLVDDGLATGYTCLGAIKWLQKRGASKVFVATPVAHQDAFDFIKDSATDVFSLFISTTRVFSVSLYYRNFPQLGDREVRETLKENRLFLSRSKDH